MPPVCLQLQTHIQSLAGSVFISKEQGVSLHVALVYFTLRSMKYLDLYALAFLNKCSSAV